MTTATSNGNGKLTGNVVATQATAVMLSVALKDLGGKIMTRLRKVNNLHMEISQFAKQAREYCQNTKGVDGKPLGDKAYIGWAHELLGWSSEGALRWSRLFDLFGQYAKTEIWHLMKLEMMMYLARETADDYTDAFIRKRKEYVEILCGKNVAASLNQFRCWVEEMKEPITRRVIVHDKKYSRSPVRYLEIMDVLPDDAIERGMEPGPTIEQIEGYWSSMFEALGYSPEKGIDWSMKILPTPMRKKVIGKKDVKEGDYVQIS
jgi:hypothetical protein